ncbi:MAG TPA: DUF58 domain-containing protein, partial [Stenomitos sp.]
MTARAIVLLLLAGATLFAAANVGVGWLYALGFLFLSYVLLAFGLAALSLRGLRVSLRPAERTTAGEALACTVALEHAGRSPRRFLSLLARPLGARRGVGPFRGLLVPEDWGHALVLEVKPGERTLVPVAFPAPARGVYRLPSLVVQAPAYGLGAVHRSVPVEAEVLVRPRVTDLPRLRWIHGSLAADREDRSAAPSAGYELIRTVREYRPGDPLKSVHWRTTAKTGELRVKETEGEAAAGGVAIALDLGAGHTPETYEHAIEVAASLCAYAHGQGIAVTLYSQEGEPADQSLEGQLDWLATRSTPPPPPARGGIRWPGFAGKRIPSTDAAHAVGGELAPPSRGGWGGR